MKSTENEKFKIISVLNRFKSLHLLLLKKNETKQKQMKLNDHEFNINENV